MKPTAIVYTSNTGFTRQYAQMLGGKTGLPVFPLPEAISELRGGSCVIYLGWLMAGRVQGYAKAAKQYQIAAVCGVGMGATGSQIGDIRKANALPIATPVFSLQGGFHLSKLRGLYRFMMTVMAKTVGRKLEKKTDRTPDEDAMLEMLLHGGSYVSEKNLKEILDWYRAGE